MRTATLLCQCCARRLPLECFTLYPDVCVVCMAMPVSAIVATARATVERELNAAAHGTQLVQEADLRATAKEAHRRALIERYGVTGKRCSACHWLKPVEAYGTCRPRRDGLQPNCKQCDKLQAAIFKTAPADTGRATWHKVRDALRVQAAAKIA